MNKLKITLTLFSILLISIVNAQTDTTTSSSSSKWDKFKAKTKESANKLKDNVNSQLENQKENKKKSKEKEKDKPKQTNIIVDGIENDNTTAMKLIAPGVKPFHRFDNSTNKWKAGGGSTTLEVKFKLREDGSISSIGLWDEEARQARVSGYVGSSIYSSSERIETYNTHFSYGTMYEKTTLTYLIYINNGILGYRYDHKGSEKGVYIRYYLGDTPPQDCDKLREILLEYEDLITQEKAKAKIQLEKKNKEEIDKASNAKASIQKAKEVALIDINKTEKVMFKNSNFTGVFDYGSGLYKVISGGKAGLVNEDGNFLIDAKYKDIYVPSEGIVGIVAENDNKGYYKLDYGWITELVYSEVESFMDGKAKVKSSDGYTGECDQNGLIKWKWSKLQTPPNSSKKTPFHDFRSKYEIVGPVLKNQGTKITKDGKIGYINLDGEIIIPCIYYDGSYLYSKVYKLSDKSGSYALYDGYDDHKIVREFKYRKIEHVKSEIGIEFDCYTDAEIEVISEKGELLYTKDFPKAVVSSYVSNSYSSGSSTSSNSSSSNSASAKVQVKYRNAGNNRMYVYYTKPDGSDGKGNITKGSSSYFTVKANSTLYYTVDDNGSGRNKLKLTTAGSSGSKTIEK